MFLGGLCKLRKLLSSRSSLEGLTSCGRRSSILVLIASFLLASWTIDSRVVRVRPGHQPLRVGGAVKRQTPSMTSPRPVSISIQSPWRSRLKSVLEETGPRVLDESDLGPVPVPVSRMLHGCNGPSPFLRLAPLELRC